MLWILIRMLFFFDETRISVTCEPKRAHKVAGQIISVIKHYATNGFKESEVEYANKIGIRKKIVGELTVELAGQIFNAVFWDGRSSLVVLVPESMKRRVTQLFNVQTSYWPLYPLAIVLGACTFAGLGYYYTTTKKK